MSDKIKYYQNILASIPYGITVLSKDLLIRTVNSAMEELSGYSAHVSLNKPITLIFSKGSDVFKLVNKTLVDSCTHSILDYTHVRKHDLSSFAAIVISSPLLNEKGGLEGVVLLMRNLRRMKELEEGLKRTEKLSMAGALALQMAHEIKNPLSGIRGSAQLLMDEIGHTEYKEYLDIITKETDRVNSIVEQLLDLSRIGLMDIKNVNIHKVLDDIIKLHKKEIKEREIQVVRNYDPSLPSLHADEDRLIQVFINLIKNSMEAISKEGELILTTKIFYDYSLVLGKKQKALMGLIEIADTGSGFSEQALKKIFMPFFTTKKRGNGLGLAISYKIVEEHGGKIAIENRKNNVRGSVARVFLPLKFSSAP